MRTVQYARNGDAHLAYTVVGEGERDVLLIPGWFSDFELGWQIPGLGRFMDELSDLGRLIVFDKRGTGQSDRILDERYPTLEERVGDVLAVLDAAGSERAALVGASEAGSQALLTAARHPERVSAVVAIDAWARLVAAEGDDLGIPRERLLGFVARATELWGSGAGVGVFAPSRLDDELFVERWSNMERRAASPGAIEAYGRLLISDVDLTGVLDDVRAPTLLLHATGDRLVPVEQSRYLADRLPDARLVEVPSADHLPFLSHPEIVIGEIQRHLLGEARPAAAPRRQFATVLFTDIADSTDRAATRGDRAWRALLDDYEELAARVVAAHLGSVVKSTGDGTLAVFDDPQSAVLAAHQLHAEVAPLGIDVRAGLHCGQVELRDDDVGGIAVHIAARVSQQAQGRTTLVSSTVRDVLLGSSLAFAAAGTHELKGVPGAWELFELQVD